MQLVWLDEYLIFKKDLKHKDCHCKKVFYFKESWLLEGTNAKRVCSTTQRFARTWQVERHRVETVPSLFWGAALMTLLCPEALEIECCLGSTTGKWGHWVTHPTTCKIPEEMFNHHHHTELHLWEYHGHQQEFPDTAALWRPKQWCKVFLLSVRCSAPDNYRRSPSLFQDAFLIGQIPSLASRSGRGLLDNEQIILNRNQGLRMSNIL